MNEANDNQPAFYTCSAMTVCSLGLSVAFVVEVVKNDQPKPPSRRNLYQTATPFNICLYTMTIAQLLIYSSELIIVQGINDTTWKLACNLAHAVRSWGIASFQLAYLFYSYVRSYPIIEQEFPSIIWVVWTFVGTTALVTVVPAICRTVQLASDANILTIVESETSLATYIELTVLDMCLLTTFVKFLHNTAVEGFDVDQHFVIISRHGIAGIAVFTTLTAIYFVFIQRNDEIYMIAVETLFTVVFAILFAMKVALRKEKEARMKERLSRVTVGSRPKLRSSETLVGKTDEAAKEGSD